jgi:hypothetical protein
MAKGQRLKPEQIVTLLRQIDVLTTNGKTLAQACKEVGTVEQSYYRWRKIYGGMKVDQARKYKDLELNCCQFRSTTKESFSIVNHCSNMG